MDERIDNFALGLAYDGSTAVTVEVTGDVDMLTAPALRAVLHALVDSGRQRIVVDLAAAGCVDGRGAAVLADISERAATLGGLVTIQSPSPVTQRMLGICGLSELIVSVTSERDLGASSVPGDPSSGEPIDGTETKPAPTGLVRSNTDMVDAALRLVTALADATITNAGGVSVTLERHGRLMTVAASNDKVLTMDRHQYETGEGPCLDAKALDRWFYIESLAYETRWPKFVPRALEQGIHSILSSPIKTSGLPQGALNIYSSTTQAFGQREQELAALFAEQASEILTTAGQATTEAEVNDRYAAALAARQVIHQAQGMVMARNGLTADDAIGLLFRAARDAHVPVLTHATELIASLRPSPGTP